MKLLTAILFVLSLICAVQAQNDLADSVTQSVLTGINLPNGTYLVREQDIPIEFTRLTAKFVESNEKFSQGNTEVLVLTGRGAPKSDLKRLRGEVENNLKSAGWIYEIIGEESGITLFTTKKLAPSRKNIFGFWVKANENLILSMSEVFVKDINDNQIASDGAGSGKNSTDTAVTISSPSKQPNTLSAGTQTINLSGSDQNVNLMGNQMPAFPSFPALVKKPGKVKGYVKDLSGRPLRGAAMALGSIRIGYSRVISQTVTDTNGYYEMDMPLNSGSFHYSAYALDYGEGKAAMTLHPVDGNSNDNPPNEGGIENFVLLPYGIANRQMLAENSNYSRSFYGGAIELYIQTVLPGAGNNFNKGKFNPGSQIEIMLTPLGNLIDGSPAKAFIIRKKIDENTRNEFFINNIPVGKYRLTIKTASGKPVGMRQRTPENSVYGIHPTEASGEADILFYPGSGDPTEIGSGTGGWQAVGLYLDAPAG